MSAEKILEKALETLGLPVKEDLYWSGKKSKYLVYVESDNVEHEHVDDAPVTERTFFQVHYYCPRTPVEEDDSRKVTKKIKKQLHKHDFRISGTTRRLEDEVRHVIVECNVITKVEDEED